MDPILEYSCKCIAKWWIERNKHVAVAQWSSEEVGKLINIAYNCGRYDMMMNEEFFEHLFKQDK